MLPVRLLAEHREASPCLIAHCFASANRLTSGLWEAPAETAKWGERASCVKPKFLSMQHVGCQTRPRPTSNIKEVMETIRYCTTLNLVLSPN